MKLGMFRREFGMELWMPDLFFREKDALPSSIYQENGVIIIATGTPSLLDVNYLCSFL